MSKTETKEKVKKIAATSFSYRNIKKSFTTFRACPEVTKDRHLELGQNNEAVIVDDRNVDWVELAQRDVDKVGLANILEIARRRGENPYDGTYAFKDEEALDLGELNPNDPESISKTLGASKEASAKLEAVAKRLGCSVDELIDSFIKGSLSELIVSKVGTKEGEGDNA